MEKEMFFTGYCRQTDSARTVVAVADEMSLTEVDCCFPDCEYARDCPIGKDIFLFSENGESR